MGNEADYSFSLDLGCDQMSPISELFTLPDHDLGLSSSTNNYSPHPWPTHLPSSSYIPSLSPHSTHSFTNIPSSLSPHITHTLTNTPSSSLSPHITHSFTNIPSLSPPPSSTTTTTTTTAAATTAAAVTTSSSCLISSVNHSFSTSTATIPARLLQSLPRFGDSPPLRPYYAALTLSNIESALKSLPCKPSTPADSSELQKSCPTSNIQLPNSPPPLPTIRTSVTSTASADASAPIAIASPNGSVERPPLANHASRRLAHNQNASKSHKKASDLLLHSVLEGEINVKLASGGRDPTLRRENHIILERQRRKSMTHLFSTLQSIVSTTRPKTNNRCQILGDAYNHIANLQKKLKELSRVKYELQLNIGEKSSSKSKMPQVPKSKVEHKDLLEEDLKGMQETICGDTTSFGAEFTMFYRGSDTFITIGNDKNMSSSDYRRDLSSILMVFDQYNLDVVNATLSTSHGNYFYSIHAKARNDDALLRLDRQRLLEDLGIKKNKIENNMEENRNQE